MVRGKRSLLQSFRFAFQGFKEALWEGKNLRIQVSLGIFALLFAYFFGFPPVEWAILLLLIGCVVSLELINTALEKTLDVVDSNTNHTIKMAKDIAAAAVLVMALVAFLIGLVFFLPRIYTLLKHLPF